jgi:prepilin-type N-terminal cleavage/methylation domain-containing protein
MKSQTLRPYSLKLAFTIVELLVSMAILSIMLIAIASAIGYVSQLFTNSVGAVDNFAKARVLLNALDRDIQMMIIRRDVGAFADPTNGPACAFYTQVQGYPGTDTRSLSLVQYSLTNSATSSVLIRQNCGMNFVAGSGLTPEVGYNGTNLLQLTNSNFTTVPPETASTGVIAFKWQFIDGNGAINTPTSTTPFLSPYLAPNSLTNYRIVVISMVVLSSSAYKLAIQTGKLSTVIADFPTSPSNLTTALPTYSQYWNNLLNNPAGGVFDTTLPAPIRGGIQVFERHIPLPFTTPST